MSAMDMLRKINNKPWLSWRRNAFPQNPNRRIYGDGNKKINEASLQIYTHENPS